MVIHLVQISWLASDHYVGSFIYVGVIGFALMAGLQFALLIAMIDKSPFAAAGLFTLLEWSRLFILSGYTWNPVGLALSSTPYSLQIASFCGVYGLTFIVILTNVFVYQRRKGALLFAALPYLLGGVFYHFHQSRIDASPKLETLLIQHATLPEEVNGLLWEKMGALLSPYYGEKVDLIVFPEAALPFSAHNQIFPITWVDGMFAYFFKGEKSGLEDPKVSNKQIAQALSKLFQATVVIGLESGNYNSAFCFTGEEESRYHKQVLLPFGEYLPFGFKWCSKYIPGFGSFLPGKKMNILGEKFGCSICYEETFGHLMRKNRLLGAELLVNLSNDVWYPKSRLPMVHYLHGRIRAVEVGLPLVRACNTGRTCGVDASGKLLSSLPFGERKNEAKSGVLKLGLPLYRFPTLYTYVGDYLILLLSLVALLPKKRTMR
ncbi:MAG: Apolipoprotein N-acyltransferase [Chlamydiales bacterium]|nr:Apolipoprotein N-acyltransferase [Chlamydiales bacterium]MCH9619763.1 Apolipoprotein N-acyltransferase [Chlamydiales bacterium]MCH9623369.1 Apolipoprotein N-acyltransferase [Chlamydiales bacterium]